MECWQRIKQSTSIWKNLADYTTLGEATRGNHGLVVLNINYASLSGVKPYFWGFGAYLSERSRAALVSGWATVRATPPFSIASEVVGCG